jgi:hypothetical protein
MSARRFLGRKQFKNEEMFSLRRGLEVMSLPLELRVMRLNAVSVAVKNNEKKQDRHQSELEKTGSQLFCYWCIGTT